MKDSRHTIQVVILKSNCQVGTSKESKTKYMKLFNNNKNISTQGRHRRNTERGK